MAGSDYYRTGKGIFGGPGGTYGRYGVSQMAGNLSSQFSKAEKTEEVQRRRFKRKRESGYSGAGFWFSNYPYMIGAMGSGTDPREETIPAAVPPLPKPLLVEADSSELFIPCSLAGIVNHK